MSGYIEHIGHKKCGSSDGLAVYHTDRDGYNAYCWACGGYEADPYGDNPPKKPKMVKSPEQVAQEMQEIASYIARDLPSRKLKSEYLSYFGATVGVSEADGATPAFVYFPYRKNGNVTAYKTRMLEPKRMWAVGDMKGTEAFGWQEALAAGGKKLFITEGEFDAIALFQALKEKQAGTQWESFNPSVISLAYGAASAAKWASQNLSALRANWKEIVLVFDQDEPGHDAVRAFTQVYPTAQVAKLPAKDANDCIMGGKSRSLADAVLFKSATPKNTRIVNASSLFEAGREQAKWGLSWPWEGMTKLTKGIRFGETYYLGAGVKMGKSEIVNTLTAHLITEHDLSVFLAKPEEANRKTVQLVAGKIAGRFFHDPEIEFDYEAYDAATTRIGSRLHLLNLYQHLGWDSLRSDIIAAHANGCRAVFIDPITNLTNGVASGEANTQLQEIAQELAAMALDLDIVIFIFCHLKAPESGNPHERGGKVLSYQFAGSRAMMRSCHMVTRSKRSSPRSCS
jgi:twinkle protein